MCFLNNELMIQSKGKVQVKIVEVIGEAVIWGNVGLGTRALEPVCVPPPPAQSHAVHMTLTKSLDLVEF